MLCTVCIFLGLNNKLTYICQPGSCVMFCIPQCNALDLAFPEEPKPEVLFVFLIQESDFQKLRHFYTKLDMQINCYYIQDDNWIPFPKFS